MQFFKYGERGIICYKQNSQDLTSPENKLLLFTKWSCTDPLKLLVPYGLVFPFQFVQNGDIYKYCCGFPRAEINLAKSLTSFNARWLTLKTVKITSLMG